MYYEFSGKEITYMGFKLKQVKALKDFNGVKRGELGGYVSSEFTLAQDGSWIDRDVKAVNCTVTSESKIRGRCIITNSFISNSIINSNSIRINETLVMSSKIYDDVEIEYCNIERSKIGGNVTIQGSNKSRVDINFSTLDDRVLIDGDNIKINNSEIKGNSIIMSNAIIESNRDIASLSLDMGSIKNLNIYKSINDTFNAVLNEVQFTNIETLKEKEPKISNIIDVMVNFMQKP